MTPSVHTASMVVVAMDRTQDMRVPGGLGAGTPVPEGDGRPDHRGTRRMPAMLHASHGWHPLSGNELLERLRVTGRRRPDADPEVAYRVRSGLEQGLLADRAGSDDQPGGSVAAGTAGHRYRDRSTLVVTKDRLTQVLACEAHQVGTGFGDRTPSVAMACGALVDVLFRQLVTVGSIGDPMADGLAALSVDDHQRPLAAWIERLATVDRSELRVEVERQVEGLIRRWPALEPSWFPRTQEPMRVQLAGGTVELSARVDLAIGRPAVDQASVAIVEVKSGARRVQHRADLHFYALVETLRSSAPPFVVATYYTKTGELDVEPITDELLSAAARRTLIGTRALQELHRGTVVGPTPTGLCGQCTALHDGAGAKGWSGGHGRREPDAGTSR